MPILGNLSEFPLPEILLLIGSRTGRLRLLDVPEFGIMDIDFSNGEAQALHLGNKTFIEGRDMIAKLSSVVQAQSGMFEFRLHPVASVARENALMVNQLVMSLVCYVDEQTAREKALTSEEQRYMLVSPQPEIWIEPELHIFFSEAQPFLISGVSLTDLADNLRLDPEITHQHLTNLRLLGLIHLVNVAEELPLNELQVQDQVSRKSNEFLRASRVATVIRKATTSMPKVKER